jgi:hypothetical protein
MAVRLRKFQVVAAAATVVAGTVVAIVVDPPLPWRDSETERLTLFPAHATNEKPETKIHPADSGDRPRLRRRPTGAISLEFPPNSYLSEWDPNTNRFTAPSPLANGDLTFPVTDQSSHANGRKMIYTIDSRQRIIDLTIFSNTRSNGRLTETQWIQSKDGVEIVWDEKGKKSWSIHRATTLLSTIENGHYFDDTPATGTSYYTISYEEHSTIEGPDGSGRRVMKPTYVVYMPAYDSKMIGLPINDLKRRSLDDGSVRSQETPMPSGATS